MAKATLEINGMSCQHCVKTVTDALTTLEGVQHVKVNLRKGEAIIRFDASCITDTLLAEAITKVGFEVVTKTIPLSLRLIGGILITLFSIIGCSDMPYTGSMLTVEDVDRYITIGEDSACLLSGDESACITLVPERSDDNRPIIHIHPRKLIYVFYYEGVQIMRAERVMDTTEIMEQVRGPGEDDQPPKGGIGGGTQQPDGGTQQPDDGSTPRSDDGIPPGNGGGNNSGQNGGNNGGSSNGNNNGDGGNNNNGGGNGENGGGNGNEGNGNGNNGDGNNNGNNGNNGNGNNGDGNNGNNGNNGNGNNGNNGGNNGGNNDNNGSTDTPGTDAHRVRPNPSIDSDVKHPRIGWIVWIHYPNGRPAGTGTKVHESRFNIRVKDKNNKDITDRITNSAQTSGSDGDFFQFFVLTFLDKNPRDGTDDGEVDGDTITIEVTGLRNLSATFTAPPETFQDDPLEDDLRN